MEDGPSPSDRLTPRNRALSDEAIDWIVRLRSGEATDKDREDFDAWCMRSPAHAAAIDEAAEILAKLGDSGSARDHRMTGAALRISAPLAQSHAINRRMILGGGIAAGLVAGLGSSGIFGPPSRLLADYGTGVGERRRLRLADGSTIWLNTASALSVALSGRERRLTLHAGEALFEVAKDRHRPFIVEAGSGEAEALGTIYSVRRHGDLAEVAVREGRVAVRSGRDSTRLVAGQRLTFGEGLLGAVRSADMTAMAAWVRGKLIFNDQPVADVMAEMERYHHGRIIVLGDRLRSLNVTGVFALDDPESLFRSVAGTAGAQVIQMPFLTILRSPS
ncbi:iron dicitrate transport regulator FecR [Sphingobium lactosutens]|uniref:FecR family protein n=1 Tax=Sphingobium lactosutens TaxID=522773 RepID=UPI001C4D3252|nr:FecR domain-containing protein [Sphingobium lactosutens]NWK94385.1 iron dicitrate transport regulator FecR [Sphingobium lactosutens]